ncbi:rhomboid family-domain-containing protein [Lentinula aff. detonsa]|uniref:Rhomboid-type serine protease n=1 Tax=Lentinula aff. detonsa TaxID=2804958 RepID=A0AA38U837_9AGAR|nr:rhomboid family-domain-containing protein [Lentinula aff. detonsa]KAJ3803334.1 rhomboid family-domain-containing protein [Lentinula aff. detonsa]
MIIPEGTQETLQVKKDEGFDHQSIISRGASPGLVRGASTSRPYQNSQAGYSGNRPPTYLEEEDHDQFYDEAYSKPQASDASLVHNAVAPAGQSKGYYQDLEYADPYAPNPNQKAEKLSPFAKFIGGNEGKYPLEQRIENKKRGIGRQTYPFLTWIISIVLIAVFIYEEVIQTKAQGTPVSFKPTVNPMLGPSGSALIYLGARFPPCMKNVSSVPPSTLLACLNDTANPSTINCPLEQVCGFNGFDNGTPNQWFRLITPIFLHAGFIHIGLNLLCQLTVSAQVEREMGSGGFFLVYFAAGIFGNVLGANFSLVGSPSTGASGAIFGTTAIAWVDLFAHWKYQYRPVRKLIFMTIEFLIGFAIGYIPYIDNFAHLGGFLLGLLVGIVFYPVISITKRHRAIMWTCRIIAMVLAVVLFVVLIRNFYTSDPYAACPGCRYLSCWPTASNNHCQGTGLSNSSSSI